MTYKSELKWIRPMQSMCSWFGAYRTGSMPYRPNTFRYTMDGCGHTIHPQRYRTIGKVACIVNNYLEKLTWREYDLQELPNRTDINEERQRRGHLPKMPQVPSNAKRAKD